MSRVLLFTFFSIFLVFSNFANPFLGSTLAQNQTENTLELSLRNRIETADGSENFHAVTKTETWHAKKTAIIVCDMWDAHPCYNAVQRVGELAPAIENLVNAARKKGATIIHAPSSCMEFYAGRPARQRAIDIPHADNIPDGIGNWCKQIPAEEKGKYPIDQSDGGEDDDPEQHEKWIDELTAKGLDPKSPWKRQIDTITIDQTRDYVSFDGPEIWNILEKHGADNVVLLGVHTNMCVLGRPFGLRQMAKNGKNVVLVRDLTDTMYNPAAWPYVNHHTGTDLTVEHIEKYVCPTVTSDQFVGGVPFRFSEDTRPRIAIVIAEDEYNTRQTVPAWAKEHLGKHYRVSLIFGSSTERNDIPGLEPIKDADLLMLSIRRRTLPAEQLQVFRDFEATGKPMIGIRTSSHPFCLMKDPPPAGLSEWREFDADVWAGNYSGHSKNGEIYHMSVADGLRENQIFSNIDVSKLVGHKSLYLTGPLGKSTTLLFNGILESDPAAVQPAAWINVRKNGGRSFYTALGHEDDFEQPGFQKLLLNAVNALTNRISN